MTEYQIKDRNPSPAFPGFPALRSNVTFVPLQFFTLVLPHCSRGCVRIVGYALRKLLGWVDAQGEPTHGQAKFSYRQLIEEAGVSREAIADALQEALKRNCLECIQPPHPDRAGESAQSGVYRIRWDDHGAYTDRPEEFRGFYYPEAALIPVQEGSAVVRRPKAARKNIPNLFFDHLLPRERLSVIRVVGALLFYSIQWGPGGERRVPVQLSVTDLSRLTRMSRQHVHEALVEARQQEYVVQVDPGRFDLKGGEQSRAATYAIHWAGAGNETAFESVASQRMAPVPVPPVAEGQGERSEKVNGEAVKKGEREQSEKVYGDRSKKVNGISIKTELKTEQTATAPAARTTAAVPASPPTPAPCPAKAAAAVALAVELLVKTGFEPGFARHLAQKRGLEVIRRQIEWLPARHTSRNRLGLLRRAIEFDWPKPEALGGEGREEPRLALGRLFASHYYAAYHGYTGPPTTEVLPRDAQSAAQFVERILALVPDCGQVPLWGQRFGEFMRQTHRDDSRARPNLAPALLLYGDAFLRSVQQATAVRRQGVSDATRAAHETAFAPAYRQYLRGAEERLQRDNAALYAAFLEERRRTRHAMTGGLFLASAETLARFDSDTSRLEAFADFCQRRPGHGVLGFWEWDARHNPQRFRPLTAGLSDQTHAAIA